MKKVPERMCAACRKRAEKNEFIRLVRTSEGIEIDTGQGKLSGRGMYLCKNIECIENAKKKKIVERSLKTTTSEEIWETLPDYCP